MQGASAAATTISAGDCALKTWHGGRHPSADCAGSGPIPGFSHPARREPIGSPCNRHRLLSCRKPMNTSSLQAPRIDFPTPDPAKPYAYPGTQVPINHFGIRNPAVLQRVVDTVAGLRGEQLENAPLPGEFDLRHLCTIHRALFQDVFAWAGQPRIADTEKPGQDFLPAAGIPSGFQHLHDELKAKNFLRDLDPEEFGDRLTAIGTASMRCMFSATATAGPCATSSPGLPPQPATGWILRLSSGRRCRLPAACGISRTTWPAARLFPANHLSRLSIALRAGPAPVATGRAMDRRPAGADF